MSSYFGFITSIVTKAKLIDGSVRSALTKNVILKSKNIRRQYHKLKLFSFLQVPIVSNSKAGLKSQDLDNYKKSYVIYNGFSNKVVHNEANKEDIISIGMLANMRWKKDFETYIKACLQLLNEGYIIKCYLIGDGPDRNKYENLIPEQYKRMFIFTGFLQNPIKKIYVLDICVLCNDISGEGLSNSIMEYMACEKPIIATDLGGNKELIENEVNGFLIDEKDVSGLSEKLKLLIGSEQLRISFGKNSRKKLYKLCNSETMINNYLNLYSKFYH